MNGLPQHRPVVIGAGLAGLLTALHLAPRPCVVLTAGRLGTQTSTGLAQGGIAAALHPDDSPALHALDTLAAGAGLGDPDVARALTAGAADAVAHLEHLGARFDRDAGGAVALGMEGAHSRPRIAHAGGDATGRELLRAAVAAVRRTPSVTVLEGTRATRVVTDDGVVRGLLVTTPDGGTTLLRTDRVVLATGGVGGLFRHSTNPGSSRGQGLALAARAGAVLRDLEMIQFHPTALDVGLSPMPLVSEAVRGAGALLVDDAGNPLQGDPLAARDVVSREVWRHLETGGRAFLDARAITDVVGRFPTVTAHCRAAGIDPAHDLVPVRPAAHYSMGGVAVDDRGRTSVPGLWAVGEVASTGLHGANRLASNSLLEAAVCSRWVADDVGHDAGPTPSGRAAPAPGDTVDPVTEEGILSLTDLRGLMSGAVGVLRDGPTLSAAVDRLHRAHRAADDDVLVALLIATCALRREESRGAHTRTDHPAVGTAVHQSVTLTDVLDPALERSAS